MHTEEIVLVIFDDKVLMQCSHGVGIYDAAILLGIILASEWKG